MPSKFYFYRGIPPVSATNLLKGVDEIYGNIKDELNYGE
jgi:hypothetical protein